jgi:multidrug efflux pump subunit AcrA (membrane-fusion protein)
MSAKVEIVVDRLDDVVYVPIQAVSPFEGGHVCWIAHGGTPERRAVTIGEFNDEFMEIKSGLKEGERVLLKPAETPAPSGKEEDAAPQPERRNPPSQPSAPPARMSKA